MSKIRTENREMGLMFSKHAYWKIKGGLFSGWPYWFKKAVITVYNHVTCAIYGHDHLCRSAPGELPVCCSCSRKVKPTPEQESSVINEW